PDYDGFKSAVHVATANHGQFNTDWGRYDYPPPIGWLLNTRPLMSAEDQQQVMRVFLGAFMEATIRNDARYVAAFRDPRSAAAWLPMNRYAAEFNDSIDIVVAHFGEDLDLSSATLPGASLSHQHLTDWREQRIRLRMGARPSRAVYLGWVSGGANAPRYTIT